MVVDKVTRAHVRSIPVGEIALFTLPDENARYVAQVTFSIMRRKFGMEFEYIKTNDPLTLAYRRTK